MPGYVQELANKRRRLETYHDIHSVQEVINIPTATSTDALALSQTHIYTGGQDGYIRRYSIADTVSGTESSYNLITRPTHLAPRTPFPVLVGCWENSDPLQGLVATSEERLTKAQFGPRGLGASPPVPVHALVVQSEEMFLLSGSDSGAINMFGARFDQGQVRHVFQPSLEPKKGHKISEPVSALVLNPGEQGFVSAGWDARVIQWDLNTGTPVRAYEDASNQVTSLAFRPTSTINDATTINESTDAAKDDNESTADVDTTKEGYDPLFDEDADAEGSSDADGTDVVAASLGVTPSQIALPIVRSTPVSRPRKTLPNALDAGLPALSNDVLLGACVDGQVVVWDRRAAGSARAFERDSKTPPWAMTAQWSRDGNQILVGRRNAAVDLYDLRGGSEATASISMPTHSGPVYSLLPLPASQSVTGEASSRYWLIGSKDVVRLYDTQATDVKSVPWKVIPGHPGGPISSLAMDPSATFVASAVGSRGYQPLGSADGVTLYVCN